MNKEISPVITQAIGLMKKINEGLEIEILSGMKRTEPSEHYPVGQLGVSTKMSIFGIEKQVFLGYQLCEDMLIPNGYFIAEEIFMMTFADDIKKLSEKKEI